MLGYAAAAISLLVCTCTSMANKEFFTCTLFFCAKVTQSFYKRKISITTSLRRNDFVNPYIERNFVSSTVFKTFLMQVRLPKYPIVSFGYFPGSQFVYLDKQRISENVYYILNGSVVYPYTAKRINMISSIV
jgi:hypothetical protein